MTNNPFNELPQVVFFDLCGTILDSKKLDHEAINYTLEKFNKAPWNITRIKKEPTKSMKENHSKIYTANSYKELNNCLFETYMRNHQNSKKEVINFYKTKDINLKEILLNQCITVEKC